MKLNRKFLISLSVSILALIASNFANAEKMRDNEICIKDASITNFDVFMFSVTDGQSYEGTKAVDGCLHIYAGRKASEDNVSFVSSRMGNNWHESNALGSENSTGLPKELNFAVYGQLTFVMKGISYTCYDVSIGQGHAATNNWWLFSNNNNKNQSLICKDHNNNITPIYFYNDIGSSSGNTYFRFSHEQYNHSKNVVRVG